MASRALRQGVSGMAKKITGLMRMKKGQLRKRLDGAGVTSLSEIFRQCKGLRISRKLVLKKALLTYQEMAPSESRAESVDFKTSRGWLEKFMRRNNISLRRKTSLAQKDPDKRIAKFVSYSCLTSPRETKA